MPTAPSQLRTELDAPFQLAPGDIDRFQKQGYIKLKQVLSPELIEHYGSEITRQVIALNTLIKPMHERTTYERAFLQVMNLWTKSDVVKEFVFSKRMARIAAELMKVRGVRLYHDQALYKEPGGGITPWHADQYYWPLSGNTTVTVWIPLQATPIELGPLAFAAASQNFIFGRDLEISDDSEAKLQAALKQQNFTYDESPFDLGEVSFHSGWTFHRAGPNTSTRPRAVMTIIYFEDGLKLIQPQNKNHTADWEAWLPGTQVGQPAQSKLNPLLYHQ